MSSEDKVAWLRQAIQARMALARHAVELGHGAEWKEISSGVLLTVAEGKAESLDGLYPFGDSTLTRLIEANDPQDTIARCKAELAILDEHGGFECMTCDRIAPCRTVDLVASGYRYWRGYLEHWKKPAAHEVLELRGE